MARETNDKTRAATTKPKSCTTCKGSGEVPTTVRVGRKRRVVGQQTGLCLSCLGSGTTS